MHIVKTITLALLISTSISTLSIHDIDGNTVSINNYQGKALLLVNIATGSPRVSQLGGLQQLKQQYGDSLVIIGFPSNSFGNEPLANAAIKQFCQTNYGVNFLLAEKADVKGPSIQPLYTWLTTQSENGMMTTEVKGDFQKYLIDKDGKLVGVFSGAISPTDNQITTVINATLN